MLPKMTEPAQYLQDLDASPRDLVASVKAQGLEGLVAKHRDSRYEPGLRSGRVAENAGQSGPRVRHWRVYGGVKDVRRSDLRVLRGRSTDLRRQDSQRVHAAGARAVDDEVPWAGIEGVPVCESARDQKRSVGSRAHEGEDERLPLVKPVLVGQFEFLEWTGDSHLRHSKFIALREDKNARDVRLE